jgi:hypothetical protein
MLKKLMAALLMMAPAITYAAGAIDGIYFCNAEASGWKFGFYMTVNGKPDGRAIYAVPAMEMLTPFYGYGIGQVSGNEFFGGNNFGLPFNTIVDGTSITGTIHIPTQEIGGVFAAPLSCLKAW